MAYGNQTVGYCDPAVRAGAVHSANSDLLDAIDSLDGALSDLAQRLSPVLSAADTSKDCGIPAPNYSAPLASDIQQKGLRLRRLADVVRDVLARLEI